MLATAIGRLRISGMLEGISFLALLAIAMPLKYLADMPEAVMWVGSIHGALFILYLLAIANVLFTGKLSFLNSVYAFVAAFLPFGPFAFDKWVLKEKK